jgi:hypothetical protein
MVNVLISVFLKGQIIQIKKPPLKKRRLFCMLELILI